MGANASVLHRKSGDFYGDQEYREYMREINKIPRLSDDEQLGMLKRASEGDQTVIDTLILANMRLAASIAAPYAARTVHFKILDLIQESSVGLMTAILTFDPKLGYAFSTYATTVIRRHLEREIAKHEDDIRVSAKMISDASAYYRLINEYEKEGKPIPSDEVAAEILGITTRALREAKASESYKPVSLNKSVDNDDGITELGDFIGKSDNGYDEVIGKKDDFDLLVALKEKLDPADYFIIYHRIISENPITQMDLGKYFHVTHQRVQQKEAKALSRMKNLTKGLSLNLSRVIDMIQKREKGLYEYINIDPVNPDKIAMFMFVKDHFNDFEKMILKNLLFPVYNLPDHIVAQKYSMNVQEYKELVRSLYERVMSLISNKVKYNSFKKNLLVTNGFEIYKIKASTKIIDYDELHQKYGSLSHNEIMDLFQDYTAVPVKAQKLFERYFGTPRILSDKSFQINGEVNAIMHGYTEKKTTVDNKKLYICYQENKAEFTLIEQLYLECFFFNKKDPKIFTNIYGPYKKTKTHRKRFRLIAKLERLHYKIDSIFDGMLTKEVYAELIRLNRHEIPSEIRELLDPYFGYETEQKPVSIIAEEHGIDSDKMRNLIFEAKDKLLVIETNRSQAIKAPKEIYGPYIEDRIYEYPDTMRNVLRLFIIQGKNHEQIAAELGLTTKEVATMLSKGVQKIDFYRFNVIDPIKIDSKNAIAFVNDPENTLSEKHKIIMLLKYTKYKENSEIATELGLKLSEVNRMSGDANAAYLKWLCKDVEITTQDIRQEVFNHPVESILTDEEKEIITLYAGINYKSNRTAKSFTPKEIGVILGITTDVSRKIATIISKLKAKKVGYTRPDLIFGLSRKEVAILLSDPHLPVSECDKNLVMEIMALGENKGSTFKDIASRTGENEKTLRRRYQMAMVNMNKFKNRELQGVINYDCDILPRLKYFPKSDRELLQEYFKENLTTEEIAKKHNLPKGYTKDNMARIINYLHLLLYIESTPKMDYDYIESISGKEDLPFNGDGKQMYDAFSLYFGQNSIQRYNLTEIKNTLNIGVKQETLKSMLQNFILACFKYQDQISREKIFSYDEIKAYYDRNSQSLTASQNKSFTNYLERYDDSGVVGQKVNKTIRNIMLGASLENPFNMATATQDEVRTILRKYYHKLSRTTRETLMARFNISEREFMTGKEINQVFRSLDECLRVEKELATPITLA